MKTSSDSSDVNDGNGGLGYEVLVPTDECKALSGYNAPVIS